MAIDIERIETQMSNIDPIEFGRMQADVHMLKSEMSEVRKDGWAAGAGTYLVSRITAGGLTINGNYQPQNGAGNPITSQIGPVIIALSAGDTITFEALHNQGGAQNTTGSASDVFLSVVKAG